MTLDIEAPSVGAGPGPDSHGSQHGQIGNVTEHPDRVWAAVPRLNARHSATPCHSGVALASARSPAGSWDSGKNVPENSISGIMTNLNT